METPESEVLTVVNRSTKISEQLAHDRLTSESRKYVLTLLEDQRKARRSSPSRKILLGLLHGTRMKLIVRQWFRLMVLSMTFGCGAQPPSPSKLSSAPVSLASDSASAGPVIPPAKSSTAVDESPPKAEPARQFTVAVAMLEGDADRKMEKFILKLLRDASTEIRTVPIDRLLPVSAFEETGGSVSEIVESALMSSGADLLIGGEVLQPSVEKRPSLFIVTNKSTSASGKRMATGLYDVSQFSLPGEFWRTLGDLIQLVVLAQASAFDESHYQVTAVEPFVQRVRAMVQSPVFIAAQRSGPRDEMWSSDSRWQVLEAYANALSILGEQAGDNAVLEESIIRYRQAFKDVPRARLPLRWAATQNNLGVALQVLGERESGTKCLEEAVVAYREALKECTHERVPLKWAMTQNNLGTALTALGERESRTKRLEEAVVAFHEALKEYTRERVPLNWAGTQTNLGNALRVLGEWESGTKRLEEAVAAYREALKEYTRERVPLDWAGTQSNLGNVLSTIADRRSKPPCAALNAHYHALLVFELDAPPYASAARVALVNDLGSKAPMGRNVCADIPKEAWNHIYEAVRTTLSPNADEQR